MTLAQFVEKWNGKGIDYDGHYGFQCVDLYRQYVQEVLQVPQSPGVTGAKDIWNSYLTEHYDRVSNSPDGIPEPGDIMIWGSDYGQYGHVAVITEANKDTFTCFSQNDPLGALCGLKKYSKWGLGWLHPKPKVNTYKGYDLTNLDSMRVAVDVLVDLQEGQLVRKLDVDKIISDGNQKLVDAATVYEKEKAILTTQISTLETALKTLQDTEHTWEGQADDYQRKLKAIVDIFASVNVQLAVESDVSVLVGTIHDYIANAEADRTFVTRVLSDTSLGSPEAVLEAIERLRLSETTIIELEKQITKLQATITTLKNKQPTLWQFIINKYFTK